MNINKDQFVTVHQGLATPEMTVVMPIYNCEEFVKTSILSMLEQQDVVIEILISDDASTDNTFTVAYKTVIDYIKNFGLAHTVLMRAGSTRLRRDHLHLLADQASCDLVCQAHGDDISHALRCSLLVKAFSNSNNNVSMIFVNCVVIDEHGKTLWQPKNLSLSNIPVKLVEYTKIINARDELLIGSNMAWRRSSLKNFPDLTTAYCAYGHDRVMAFRSFLNNGCYLMDAPLMQRRLHDKNFHKELLLSENKSIISFNTALIRLSVYSSMKNDLNFSKENNALNDDKFNQISTDINNKIVSLTILLTMAMRELVADGYTHTWDKIGSEGRI
jgi:glycosyltransferase involved in cell wall biosynthesis